MAAPLQFLAGTFAFLHYMGALAGEPNADLLAAAEMFGGMANSLLAGAESLEETARVMCEARMAAERPVGSLFDQFMAAVMQPVVMVDNMVSFGLDLINDPDPDTVAGRSSIAAQTVGRLGTGMVACTAGGVLVVYGVGRFAYVTYESGGAMSGEAFAELCVYGYNGYTLFAVGWTSLVCLTRSSQFRRRVYPLPERVVPLLSMWFWLVMAALWLVSVVWTQVAHHKLRKPVPRLWKVMTAAMALLFVFQIGRWFV